MTAAILAMVINLGAYSAEIVRAGIAAVPRGQFEAGASLALAPFQVFRHVVLLPALRKIWPALSSQVVIVMLGSLIPVGEALKDTGTAALMADGLTIVAAHLSGPLAVGLILVVSMLVTPFLHHAAAVVVMGPVAAAVARPLTERARYTRRAATSQTAASAVGPLSGRRPIAPGRGTRR